MFGKKKSAFERVVEMYNGLDDEEKAKVKEKITDVEKAEDEREIDKIEEEKAATTEKADEKREEVKEESEEVGKEVDEAEEEEFEDKPEDYEGKEEEGEEHEVEEHEEDDEPKVDLMSFKKDVEEMFQALNNKIDGLAARKTDDVKRPFGKGEDTKEYGEYSKRESSDELFKRYFPKN